MEATGGVVVDASRVAGVVVTVTTRAEEPEILNVMTALDTYGQHLEHFTQQVAEAPFRVPAQDAVAADQPRRPVDTRFRVANCGCACRSWGGGEPGPPDVGLSATQTRFRQ
jgi:hypothetical protein